MSTFARAALKITLAVGLGLLLTACALRAMFGNVIIVEDIAAEVNEIIETVFTDSTAAVCLNTDYGFFECTYIIDGDIITSTLYLLGEFGITGVLIDPLIAQVPSDATVITATYDLGGGPQPLSVQQVGAFKVMQTLTVTAEAGQKFLILQLPPGVESTLPQVDPAAGLPLSYTLGFSHTEPLGPPVGPQTIKLLSAGRVVVNGYTFYVPILPCETDFANIPALTLPQAATPQDLQPALGAWLAANPNAVCDHTAYYYDDVPPPLPRLFLPLITRGN
jgi:hypothetical protein